MAAMMLFKYLALPPALTHLVLNKFTSVSLFERLLLSFASIIAHVYIQLYLYDRQERKRAEAMGARRFTRLRTWWPLNLGVLVRAARNVNYEPPFTTFMSYFPPGELTIDSRIFGGSDLVTMDERVVQHILVDDFNNYVKGEIFAAGIEPVTGHTLLTKDPHNGWKEERARYKPYLSASTTRDLERFRLHVDRFLDNAANQKGEPYDIGFALSKLFLDTSTQLITSRSVACQSSDPVKWEAGERFLHNFEQAMHIAGERLLSGPLWNLTQPKGAQLVSDTNKALDNFLYPLVDEVLADVSSGTEIEAPLHGFSEFYDRAKLRDNLLTMIVGSHDTLTGSVTSLFYELARHPEIMKEARKAVSNQLEDAMEPALEDIKALPILRAIFDETLRLYPAGAVNGREAIEDTFVVIDGERRFIPGGTFIATSVWHLQRRKDLWGDDADEWKPSRWLQGPGGTFVCPAAPGAWQPFHAGPRFCMGMEFAYNQALYLLIRLLQRYDRIEPAWTPDKKPMHVVGFTLQIKNAVMIRMKEVVDQ